MATKVNPPPQLRIPNQFLSEPLTTAYFREIGVILFQLWKRSGGNDDDLANLILQVAINTEDIAENAATIAINALNIINNADNIAINAANILLNKQAISEAAVYSGYGAQIQFLQKQIDGLPEFTIDTTGFTFDSTKITFDKVIV